MRRLRVVGIVTVLPVAAALILSAGCGGDNKSADKGGGDNAAKVDKGTKTPDEKKGTPAGKKEELASTGWGTLKGKVTFEGELPAINKDIIAKDNKDRAKCEKGDTAEQTWKIGPDKGVANVVVWLRAPAGKYFKVPDDKKEVNETVKIDQTHCAFEPHVVALYPSFFDGKEQKKTGQVFEVVNSAEDITHNTNWNTTDATLNKGDNVILQAKTGSRKIAVITSREKQSGGEQSFSMACNIHPWMRAYALAFDHPFAAVTSGDKQGSKEFGTFEIKEAPAGVELDVMYWHESMGPFSKANAKKLKSITLKPGDNTVDFTIKK
jgi:hypothetical protein